MLRFIAERLANVRPSDRSFALRHRFLKILLLGQTLLIAAMAVVSGHIRVSASGTTASIEMTNIESALQLVPLGGVAICLALGSLSLPRRVTSTAVSVGLMLSAAEMARGDAAVQDMCFMVALCMVGLYQDIAILLLIGVLVVAYDVGVQALSQDRVIAAASSSMVIATECLGTVMVCAAQIAYWIIICREKYRNAEIWSKAEATLRKQQKLYNALFRDAYDVICVTNEAGRITSASPSVERVMGYRPEDLVGSDYQSLVHPDDVSRTSIPMREVPLGYQSEIRVRHSDGSWCWYEASFSDLNRDTSASGIVVHHHDIAKRRAVQDKLEHEASHDVLTGLPNRVSLLCALEKALAEAERDRRQVAVLYIDLDNFKKINDTQGHASGDALLVAVAGILRRSVRCSDTVGRLGGDEFAVVLKSVEGLDDATSVAGRIATLLRAPIMLHGVPTSAHASIGIALSEAGSMATDLILGQADTAMYHTKREKRSDWTVFVDGLGGRRTETDRLADDLRNAVPGGQLRVLYQPIVALDGGEVQGFEALVRWMHPTRGIVPPSAFIAIAERTGLINEIGLWVLSEACKQVATWQARMPKHRLTVSVNLSPRQLTLPTLVEDVLTILDQTRLDPQNLVLEITESAMVDETIAIPPLVKLSEHRIRIALDDFGTGYSSLRYLTRLPVHALKLDRCFVAELNGTEEGAAVAEAVVRLAQILHLDTIAEGVESPEQACELMLMGCRAAQGYFYARPEDPETVNSSLFRHGFEPPSLPLPGYRCPEKVRSSTP